MTKTPRIPLSKKTRFDVFKRDLFTCQYCGATPPGVLLHVDHITAVTRGGTNDDDNLVTACEACNLGKGALSLDVVPQSLADKAQEIAEREAQILGYQSILNARRERLIGETWQVLETMHQERRPKVPQDEFNSTRRFVELLGLHEVLEAAEKALGIADSLRHPPFRYFCGVCWNKVRKAKL